MAEPRDGSKIRDQLKTVQLSPGELKEIAAQEEVQRLASLHDGRFGESFDDELNVASVVWVAIGVIAITVVGFLGSWWFYQWLISAQQAATPEPTPVVAEAQARHEGRRQVPSGPLLQASPEEELREMRKEMRELTQSYGWVDEAAGVVYIPIDKAIDKVLERGLGPAGPSEEPEAP